MTESNEEHKLSPEVTFILPNCNLIGSQNALPLVATRVSPSLLRSLMPSIVSRLESYLAGELGVTELDQSTRVKASPTI